MEIFIYKKHIFSLRESKETKSLTTFMRNFPFKVFIEKRNYLTGNNVKE